ncbi:putative reverse transcriptase domain-containing protein [Tanacetum coccineum]|uniref:Reverse transcriptase domain-containing protein n=1 Tax=Tanacetum coccineum TaxID=301880 RepID=A0ABQ4ZHF6_9ASTR
MHGCSYKTFMNGKPRSFKGTEGVVGQKHWFEKMEQVFEIFKCAEDDNMKFAMCTFEGRALTWWNGNVQTLGLANANQIPWSNVKAMMTTEYCPATEIQRMEQELWTLTLKGDDIEAYSNRFHELVLMCPELVSTESKKIEKYIRGFPERIKGNITSSKPANLHEAINMARELVEQSVQGRAARIGKSNKRKWEDNQRNNNNNNHNYNNNHNNNNNNRNRNNNHHQQQNRRPENVRAYVAAPAGGKIYAENLPKCNRCNLHHHGPCPQKCQRCQRLGHMEKDVRVRLQVLQVMLPYRMLTCFGCGVKGHFKEKCMKSREQLNDGAHGESLRLMKREKKLDDIRVVRDFPEVFPDDLSGLPLVREIEFRIDLIPGASPVVRSPYRLAPSEMLEFVGTSLKNFKEEKGFIRTIAIRGGSIALRRKEKNSSQDEYVLIEFYYSFWIKTKILERRAKLPSISTSQTEWLEGLEDTLSTDIQFIGAVKIVHDMRDFVLVACNKKFLSGNGKKIIKWTLSQKFPNSSSGHDTILVVVDKIDKSAHSYLFAVNLLNSKVGDSVLLKVFSWRGVVRLVERKLSPRYVGPFEIVECVLTGGLSAEVTPGAKLCPRQVSMVAEHSSKRNMLGTERRCFQGAFGWIEIDVNLRICRRAY